MRPNDDPTIESDRPNKDLTSDQTRLTVAQAARVLGLSAEAVRMRVKRGTLPHVKEDSTVYVLLDPSRLEADQTQPNDDQTHDQTSERDTDQSTSVEALRAEVEFLREELRHREERHAEESRRKDHLLAAALERIPAIEAPVPEAPPEARESPEPASEEPTGGGVPPEQQKRSWWRKLFGG